MLLLRASEEADTIEAAALLLDEATVAAMVVVVVVLIDSGNEKDRYEGGIMGDIPGGDFGVDSDDGGAGGKRELLL